MASGASVSGQPLGERVAWCGPIVMTQAELPQACAELERDTFLNPERRKSFFRKRAEPDDRVRLGATMNVQRYKQRLLDLEAKLLTRVAHEREQAREQVIDVPRDAADDSVSDEGESEDLTEAELDAAVLRQVRDALQRIEDGTYGHCLVDGKPIDTDRLDAVPWAAYCSRHQEQLEAASRPAPTL
jgi:DnaK suppressor protein